MYSAAILVLLTVNEICGFFSMDAIMVNAVGRTGRGTLDWNEKGKTNISRIYICHDNMVRSLRFGYTEGTSIVLSPRSVLETGLKFDAISLDYPSEYITGIKGIVGVNGIYSITFDTNKGSYGPFGTAADHYDSKKEFSMQFGTEFYGFHGHEFHRSICGLGAYIKPSATAPSSSQQLVKGGKNLLKSEAKLMKQICKEREKQELEEIKDEIARDLRALSLAEKQKGKGKPK